MPNPRDAHDAECPTCRAHLAAVVASNGHVAAGQWTAYLEHRASRSCQSGKPVRRRASRRRVRQAVYS